MTEAYLPYGGTSGWSGSEASHDRAVSSDQSGQTRTRQQGTVAYLRLRGAEGVTWPELGRVRGWHHGTASGVLSVLHKEGVIARLKERRDKCSIYVLPEFVNGRATSPHGRKKQRTGLSADEWYTVLKALEISANAYDREAADEPEDSPFTDELLVAADEYATVWLKVRRLILETGGLM
jgi:hypothetical protein